MSRLTGKISALLIAVALVVGVAAAVAPSVKAQYYNPPGYNPPGVGAYNPPGYNPPGMGGYYPGAGLYNPISQWLVLSSLFSPYGALY